MRGEQAWRLSGGVVDDRAMAEETTITGEEAVTLAPPSEPLLSVDGAAIAANHVSFDLSLGETMGLVGESGSGKSVTSRSILRLVPEPGEIIGGSIRFGGRDVLDLSEREMRAIRGAEISMIFQDPMSSLNPVYPIGDQIVEPLRIHRRMNRRQARAEAVSLLDRVGIPSARERVDSYPHELSGGMRQRVMIAIAISCRPKLLLADEPTTALDVTIQDQILNLLLELQAEEGMAILLVSHDLGVIAQTCDRVTVMYAGYVVEQATTEALFARPRHPYTLGLLESVPRLDAGRRQRLKPIEGAPRDMLRPPQACPFQPRCRFEVEQSRQEVPPLVEIEPGHAVACFNPVPADLWQQERALKTA